MAVRVAPTAGTSAAASVTCAPRPRHRGGSGISVTFDLASAPFPLGADPNALARSFAGERARRHLDTRLLAEL